MTGLLLLAGSVIASIATTSLVRWLLFVFSSRDTRLQRVRHIALVSTRYVFVSVVAVAVFRDISSYWKSAHLRSIITEANCDTDRSPDGLYLAHHCHLGDTRVVRLYDRDGKHLLAERTYQDYTGVLVHVYWEEGALHYQYRGAINLPPSLFDRLLAKLP